MKLLLLAVFGCVLGACGTIGGTIGGAGKDLQRAGEWIKSK